VTPCRNNLKHIYEQGGITEETTKQIIVLDNIADSSNRSTESSSDSTETGGLFGMKVWLEDE
jgi:hypothetical protein